MPEQAAEEALGSVAGGLMQPSYAVSRVCIVKDADRAFSSQHPPGVLAIALVGNGSWLDGAG